MIKKISVLSLSLLFFLSACVPSEKVEINSQEVVVKSAIEEDVSVLTEESVYGVYTDDIQNLLEASPIGSEIYLKEGDHGEWHLRIEKIFTAESFSEESAKYFEDTIIDEKNSEIISGSDVSTPEILTI